MKTKILRFVYSFFIYPVFIFAMKVAAVFNKKINKALRGRKGWQKRFVTFSVEKKYKETLWFHVASAGELLQALPVLEALYIYRESLSKDNKFNIILTFFSPSTLNWLHKFRQADFIDYFPGDSYFQSKKIVQLLNPKLLILVKYDLWPNMIWQLSQNKKSIMLISAVLRQDSARINNKIAKVFFKNLYAKFSSILAVTHQDEKLIKGLTQNEKSFPEVNVIGDTKVDSVIKQKKLVNLKKDERLKWLQESSNNYCILGSCWPADLDIVIDWLKSKSAKKEKLDWKFIIAPHEVLEINLKQVMDRFLNWGTLKRYKTISENDLAKTDFILVDEIGVLAGLYSISKAAFVGTGSGGVHNVLEPVVFNINTGIRMKRISNSPEAQALVKLNSITELQSKTDFDIFLQQVKNNSNIAKAQRISMEEYISQSQGATRKCVDRIAQVMLKKEVL